MRTQPPECSRPRSLAAFTMIEIAIALGVIGFALVAIIGILPAGLEVQRDNRSETIINQDGTFWLEAIRNGARGLDDLTNYVDEITIIRKAPEAPTTYVFGAGGLAGGFFTTGADVISLLTSSVTNALAEQRVRAIVTAFSGSAAEKDINKVNRELSFKYRMSVTITNAATTAVPFSTLSPPLDPTIDPLGELSSLYEIRLTFEYPYLETRANSDPNYNPSRRQSYRVLASRKLVKEDFPALSTFFFEP